MVTAKEIPAWTDRTEKGLRDWWRQMTAKGLAFHPDDLPETIVTVQEGAALFDYSACQILRGLIGEMLLLYGDRVYDAGHEALMESLGWAPGPSGDWVQRQSSENAG